MHVKSVTVKSFRLLSDATIALSHPSDEGDDQNATTVVVGRNNSGKTSFTEVFRRFAGGTGIGLEDFSTVAYGEFCEAFKLYSADGQDEAAVRDLLPFVELRITVAYAVDLQSYGPLAPFIVDLDPTAEEAIVVARYELGKGKLADLFDGITRDPVLGEDAKPGFLNQLRPRIPRLYERTLMAEDPNDPSNQRQLKRWNDFERLFSVAFISAQRGLDDVTDRQSHVLAGFLERLFTAANSPSATAGQQQTATDLAAAVEGVQETLNKDFAGQLEALVPALGKFGYPGLNGPTLKTQVTLAVEKLLKDNTEVSYAGHYGVALPEAYNGLGSRNLIYMLLQLLGFHRTFLARGAEPGIQIIFVEEPEAHLHPQMQEVFIRQLNRLTSIFADMDDNEIPWPSQFVVTTHSAHIANEARFTAIRYFLAAPENAAPTARSSVVRDLSQAASGLDTKFLHQYLTLTRCDLFFADKAILVEGTTERLLLPRMIKRLEAAAAQGQTGLESQYVTLLEVGGAYAHKFFGLLDFLQLPALIITDLDAVAGEKGEKSLVADGTSTSNATLKDWFGKEITPEMLLAAEDDAKVKHRRRVAYEVPENDDGPCGRTFEDAFILANPSEFGLNDEVSDWPSFAQAKADKTSKSDFALTYAIDRPDWTAPRYISEGLAWLLSIGDLPEGTSPSSADGDDKPSVAVTS